MVLTNRLLFFSFAFILLSLSGQAQCGIQSNATPGMTLTFVQTNVVNCSGVAYNPHQGLYYSVRAGNANLPLETWNSSGQPVNQTTAGFDYRGMWWNPTTEQLESNGYNNSGIWKANLNSNGYATNQGAVILMGNQPHWQACGDLDYDSYEIVYYYSGSIFRYSRITNTFLGTYSLQGLPVSLSNINSTSVVYTGCPGNEIGVLDFVNKRLLLFNKANGQYSGYSQLPSNAPANVAYRMSWANGMLWLFNPTTYTWYSYNMFSSVLGPEFLSFTAFDSETIEERVLEWEVSESENWEKFQLEKSIDGSKFVTIGNKVNEGGSIFFEIAAGDYGQAAYYRITGSTQDGERAKTEVVYVAGKITEIDIQLYPNPSSGFVNINVLHSSEELTNVTVNDMSGKTLISKEFHHNHDIRLDLQDLPSGTYFCKVRNGSEIFGRMLVIAR